MVVEKTLNDIKNLKGGYKSLTEALNDIQKEIREESLK
jgi:hypothetical protein